MKEKFSKFLDNLKKAWQKLTKRVKIIIVSVAAVLLIAAIVITAVLNSSAKNDYIVLFPDMTADESTEVYLELQNMGVETLINKNGEIEVPADQWDTLVYELAEKGYPQSTPSYGTFFDNLSMTMTEFEKKQSLRFELQDRLQTTISRIEGVKGAIVTISVPETSDYAWTDNDESATATVTLTLENPETFSSDNVSAIKNLVAYSAQQMEPSDVKVINANTGTEIFSSEELDENKEELDSDERIYYENIIKEQLEYNAEKILSAVYGKDGVVAVANVSVDYDKITQEIKELITNEDGEGVKENQSIQYKVGDTVDAGGIVGEEDNSDIPNYGNLEDDLSSDDANYYQRDTEWAIGYILTQKEQARGILTDASIAVVVTTKNSYITDKEKEALVELVKNATNIDAEKISVYSNQEIIAESNDKPKEDDDDGNVNETLQDMLRPFIIIITLIVLGALLIIALIVYIITKNARRKMEEQKKSSQEAIRNLQNTIDENNKKQTLIEAAMQHNKEEQNTANEVKEFVQKNPEVTAAIIRAMLKEDE
jgi:flagellar basal-body M-ring protein/flagellar hook-basal body protein fliF